AETDALTGLANRAALRARLDEVVERAKVGDGTTGPALVLVDVDGFAEVNGGIGHDAGDHVLIELTRRMRGCVPGSHTLARFGSDEFAVVVPARDGPRAEDVAHGIVSACAEPVSHDGRQLLPYVSVGVARWTPSLDAEHMLRNAEAAMAAAKAAGGNCHVVYDPTSHVPILARMELAADLRGCLQGDQLKVLYQPIVATGTGRIAGVEALVRWDHPKRGLVPPGRFITVAEQTGMILDIGRWVLDTACRQAVSWQRRLPSDPPLYMSVNLSARQLWDETLADDVDRILARSGLAPEHLALEITETSLVSDFEETVDALRRLKGIGVRLSIDDFGTGYSSLAYLRRLPVDVVKIDRAFVEGIATSSDEWALAVAIVRLVRALDLETVAEGVEGPAQLAHLRALGCDYAQGYYVARPQDAGAIEALLSERWPADGQVTEGATRR
ncbi:MAG TPA: bifunctional diguanylate cyclase/phosphodiesterase, partial [Acidimicrobiales bacterium]|nr:bifunctional diguanylate cyclase/phosphodiesterase [Acidimicrobiales bacterium]